MFVAYLPAKFAEVTPILFGLGAVQVAKFPNGAMTENARQVLWAWDKVRHVSKPNQAFEPTEASIPAQVVASQETASVGGDLV